MPQALLNCYNCGAPAPLGATSCKHCSSSLASISCPGCLGMIFEGSKFCPHCGGKVNRTAGGEKPHPCPCCKELLSQVTVGEIEMEECSKCRGIWINSERLESICANHEKQAMVITHAAVTARPVKLVGKIDKIKYIPCPECADLMHRVNFAQCSGVIVDVCKKHGSWFDEEELARVMQFIREGGMDMARTKEKAKLEEERRRLESARRFNTTTNPGHDYQSTHSREGIGIEFLADLARAFLD